MQVTGSEGNYWELRARARKAVRIATVARYMFPSSGSLSWNMAFVAACEAGLKTASRETMTLAQELYKGFVEMDVDIHHQSAGFAAELPQGGLHHLRAVQ